MPSVIGSLPLDTRFERTSTGVFVAFQRLEQHLDPSSGRCWATDVAVERLQLLLSQDLNVLLDLSADWALRVNMELSRGETLASAASDGALPAPGHRRRRRLLLGTSSPHRRRKGERDPPSVWIQPTGFAPSSWTSLRKLLETEGFPLIQRPGSMARILLGA